MSNQIKEYIVSAVCSWLIKIFSTLSVNYTESWNQRTYVSSTEWHRWPQLYSHEHLHLSNTVLLPVLVNHSWACQSKYLHEWASMRQRTAGCSYCGTLTEHERSSVAASLWNRCTAVPVTVLVGCAERQGADTWSYQSNHKAAGREASHTHCWK